MKKILALVLALMMLLSCGAFAEEAKPVILMVSFGTSYNENRDLSIGGIEAAIQAAYPDWEVRRIDGYCFFDSQSLNELN